MISTGFFTFYEILLLGMYVYIYIYTICTVHLAVEKWIMRCFFLSAPPLSALGESPPVVLRIGGHIIPGPIFVNRWWGEVHTQRKRSIPPLLKNLPGHPSTTRLYSSSLCSFLRQGDCHFGTVCIFYTSICSSWWLRSFLGTGVYVYPSGCLAFIAVAI